MLKPLGIVLAAIAVLLLSSCSSDPPPAPAATKTVTAAPNPADMFELRVFSTTGNLVTVELGSSTVPTFKTNKDPFWRGSIVRDPGNVFRASSFIVGGYDVDCSVYQYGQPIGSSFSSGNQPADCSEYIR